MLATGTEEAHLSKKRKRLAKLKEDELHAELEHEEAQFIHDEADADKRALEEADAVTALQAQLEAMPEGPEKEALRKRLAAAEDHVVAVVGTGTGVWY